MNALALPMMWSRAIARSNYKRWVKITTITAVWVTVATAIAVGMALVALATIIVAGVSIIMAAFALLLIPFRW